MKLKSVNAIILHFVGNPGSTAQQNRNYFDSKKSLPESDENKASAQFILDDEEILRCMPEDEVAFHAGPYSRRTVWARNRFGEDHPNLHTIALEHCHPGANGIWTPAVWRKSLCLSAILCIQYDLNPYLDIGTHFDVTGKECPKWFVDDPKMLHRYRAVVASIVAA